VKPLLLTQFTATSCAGRGLDATLAALREQRGGLAPCRFERATLDTWIGEVEGVNDEPVRADLRDFDCRNNRLAQLGLTQDGLSAPARLASSRPSSRTGSAIRKAVPCPPGFTMPRRTIPIRPPASCALISR
jgi:3-oxoacyl-[acyl-carrier-protein] synthase-1